MLTPHSMTLKYFNLPFSFVAEKQYQLDINNPFSLSPGKTRAVVPHGELLEKRADALRRLFIQLNDSGERGGLTSRSKQQHHASPLKATAFCLRLTHLTCASVREG